MRKILVLAISSCWINGPGFSHELPSYSAGLMYAKNVAPNYSRWTYPASTLEFGTQIFARPHGISSFVYNDPPYTQGTNLEILMVIDPAWDRFVVYGNNNWSTANDKQFILVRGTLGTQPWQFRSPRYITGDASQIYVSDTYNNRVHIYDISIEVPEDTTGFRGFDSLANGGPLRTPLGIDVVFYYCRPPGSPDSFAVKNIAVADYGNNRVVIFPSTFTGGTPGQSYPSAGETRFQFNQPTTVAYGWNKATGWQKNELFVVSNGDGQIYWLKFNRPCSGTAPDVVSVFKYDFLQLFRDGLVPGNGFLSSAAVDNHGLLWILDSNNGMVYKFWPSTGVGSDSLIFIGSWGGLGTGDGQLNYPNGIAAQHGVWVDRCGGNPGCPNNVYPLANLHDILVTETWGPTTGVRRFGIGIEAFADSAKYTAKTSTGNGNFVDFHYRLTDYARVTEKVYLGSNLVDSVKINQEVTPSSNSSRWFVGNKGNGDYRIEITANSLYGDASDVKNFTVAVDTALRNNAPGIAVQPHFKQMGGFFPTKPGANHTLLRDYGGGWVKVTATDLDNDPLSYYWVIDTAGWVIVEPSFAGSSKSRTTPYDSVFYQVPDWLVYPPPGGSPASPPEGPCNVAKLRLTVSDPAGNVVPAGDFCIGLTLCKRGDMDADKSLTSADVVLQVNAAFLGLAPPPFGDYRAVGDMNCDGVLSSADVVFLMNVVYLDIPPPC